jgi:hypothetical protein
MQTIKNHPAIIMLASNFRNVRGRSVACAIFDECAFWQSELTANPDVEVYQAVVPSLATLPGAMLIGISTPYRRAGLLWQKHRDHYGQDDDDVLVVRGPSRLFNPTLPEKVVQDALKRDPAAARAEWLAEIPDVLEDDESALTEEEFKRAQLKKEFEWALGEGGATHLICQLTKETKEGELGELIVDPFAGTALWGLIAQRKGRRWIGADVAEGGSMKIVV